MSGPVILRVEQDHPWTRRSRRGCAICGRARAAPQHLGAPPSLNIFGSGNQRIYQSWKTAWSDVLAEHLSGTRLAKPLTSVLVEGRVCFPTRVRRDQGNYRFLLEKALGDTLTAGGWLIDDDWSQYEFGNLAYVYEKGRSWTELVLFPGAAVKPLGGRRMSDETKTAAWLCPECAGPSDVPGDWLDAIDDALASIRTYERQMDDATELVCEAVAPLLAATHASIGGLVAMLAQERDSSMDEAVRLRRLVQEVAGGFRDLIETCANADRSQPYEWGEARADGRPAEAQDMKWHTPREAAKHWSRVLDDLLGGDA